MNRNLVKSGVLAVAGAIVFAAGSMGGAVAAGMIGSEDIRNNSLLQEDLRADSVGHFELKDGSVRWGNINELTQEKVRDLAGEDGTDGKDGVSNLIVGAGYTSTWEAHSEGETIETCPEGQYAIGGGYSMWGGFNGKHDGYDLGGSNTDIQVTVSAPYFKGEYVPVDEAGNFRADQWVVRGFNHGDTDQIVRAWVVCANVAD